MGVFTNNWFKEDIYESRQLRGGTVYVRNDGTDIDRVLVQFLKEIYKWCSRILDFGEEIVNILIY